MRAGWFHDPNYPTTNLVDPMAYKGPDNSPPIDSVRATRCKYLTVYKKIAGNDPNHVITRQLAIEPSKLYDIDLITKVMSFFYSFFV